MFDWRDYGNGIVVFDVGYVCFILVVIYMVIENGCVVVIDLGSNDVLFNVLVVLEMFGFDVVVVDYVIFIYIYFDYVGGVGGMMVVFLSVWLVVYLRGVCYMVELLRLIVGVMVVYGVEYVQWVYGEIVLILVVRIVEVLDSYVISLVGCNLLCFDMLGYVCYYICIVD